MTRLAARIAHVVHSPVDEFGGQGDVCVEALLTDCDLAVAAAAVVHGVELKVPLRFPDAQVVLVWARSLTGGALATLNSYRESTSTSRLAIHSTTGTATAFPSWR